MSLHNLAHSIFRQAFQLYNGWLIRNQFHTLLVRGEVGASRPTLYVVNHSSWWDGLLIYQAYRMLDSQQDHRILINAEGLHRYPFFGKLGAFPVDRSSPAATVAGLRACSTLLKQGSHVWMFPQGKIEGLELRPLSIQPGTAFILQHNPDVQLKFVTLYYSVGDHQRPLASIIISDEWFTEWRKFASREELTEEICTRLEAQLDRHRAEVSHIVTGDMDHAVRLFQGRRSVSDWFDTLRRKGWGR